MANKIQLRRGTKAQLATLGSLSVAEPGYCTDTKELFIGNASGGNTPLVTATSADITYYVRTDGSDSNTGLANTAGGAFKTVQKAISMLPQVINHIVVINVAAGNYVEEVELKGFSGKGGISIQGGSDLSASTNYKVKNAVVKSNSVRISFTGIEFTAADSVKSASMCIIDNPGYTEFVYCRSVFTNKNNSGIFVSTSPATVAYICEISNKQYAVFCTYSGAISVQNFTGSGNDIRFRAAAGGNISVVGSSSTGGDMATDGAIIAPNSGVLNPWGDNTMDNRSYVEAAPIVSQANIPAITWTKVGFGSAARDNLGEYNAATSTVTVSKAGIYEVSVFLGFEFPSTVSTTVRSLVEVYINGGSAKMRFSDSTMSNVTSLDGNSTQVMRLSAGDTLSVYAYCSVIFGVSPNWQITNFKVIRIA